MKNLTATAIGAATVLLLGLAGCDDEPETAVLPVKELGTETMMSDEETVDDNLDDGAPGGVDQFDELSLRFPAGWTRDSRAARRRTVPGRFLAFGCD